MQFKLLQTYRTVSNFSISLIMEFIPFLVLWNATPVYGIAKAVILMFAYWAMQNLFILLFNFLLKKQYFKKPQIFLLLRILPIIACEICILFLHTNALWVIALAALFSGMENSFNYVPTEIIYNYVTEGQGTKVLGFTRFLDQMGWVVAGAVGGLFLDYISKTLVVGVSLLLFFASAVPLVIFYFKFRNTANFNTDYVSYLVAQQEGSEKVKKLRRSFLIKHFVANFLISPFYYLFYYVAEVAIYINTESFFITGIMSSIFDGIYGIACLYAGKILSKCDGKNLATIMGFVMLGLMLVCFLVPNIYIMCVAFLLCSFIQPFIILHPYQDFLDKARILGVGNDMLINYGSAQVCSYVFCYTIGACGGVLLPVIIASSVIGVAGILFGRKVEESTTQDLVNYLSNNK